MGPEDRVWHGRERKEGSVNVRLWFDNWPHGETVHRRKGRLNRDRSRNQNWCVGHLIPEMSIKQPHGDAK